MQVTWFITDNNSLGLRYNDDTYTIPSAYDIFLVEYRNKTQICNVNVLKPSLELGSISFSKYPIDIRVLLEPITTKDNLYIEANIVAVINDNQLNILNLIELGIDHIIIGNIWYPFEKGGIQEIKQLLKEVGIEKFGKITLEQYLLIKISENPLVIDKVKEMPIDKGTYISNKELEIPYFNGKLYPYQNQGYRWLKMIVNENIGCILADEMGLGKTAQIIAVLANESINSKNPSLVVAPVSLLENWNREIQKFAPKLSVLIHQGNNRTGFYSKFNDFNLVITSYETILRDLSLFQMLKWNIVIADEAQAIKNPLAKRTLAIKQIDRRSTIAVTGTPIENKLMDLWSLADFAFQGYLGDLKHFQDMFSDELDCAENLEPLISPILLRRRIRDVAVDLPERINIPQVLKLSKEEANLYESFRIQIIEEYGKKASLVSLIKLRMFCTHPFLQLSDRTDDPTVFSKYMRLVEILEEIISNQEKVIIFTSYKRMSDILLEDLTKRFNIHCAYIDGRINVQERQIIIDRFSETQGSAILILNPRAAGSGLNITAANHVIHYNLEWNPAIEDQASARAHRRGQTRPVTVYRLFCANTVEETINDRLNRKRELSETAIIGTDGSRNDKTDILEALFKSPLT